MNLDIRCPGLWTFQRYVIVGLLLVDRHEIRPSPQMGLIASIAELISEGSSNPSVVSINRDHIRDVFHLKNTPTCRIFEIA